MKRRPTLYYQTILTNSCLHGPCRKHQQSRDTGHTPIDNGNHWGGCIECLHCPLLAIPLLPFSLVDSVQNSIFGMFWFRKHCKVIYCISELIKPNESKNLKFLRNEINVSITLCSSKYASSSLLQVPCHFILTYNLMS